MRPYIASFNFQPVSTLLEILDFSWSDYCIRCYLVVVSTLLEILGLVYQVLVGF